MIVYSSPCHSERSEEPPHFVFVVAVIFASEIGPPQSWALACGVHSHCASGYLASIAAMYSFSNQSCGSSLISSSSLAASVIPLSAPSFFSIRISGLAKRASRRLPRAAAASIRASRNESSKWWRNFKRISSESALPNTPSPKIAQSRTSRSSSSINFCKTSTDKGSS
jgi:hypothetical protein